MSLTLSKSVEFTQQRSEDIGWRGEVIHQMDPHAAHTDENVRDGEVGEVEVDGDAEGPLDAHRYHHGQVAKQGGQHGAHV